MKPLAFNLSKMKKIGGDKNSTTFKHQDGHTIRIAHSGVSAVQRKQLERLPIYKDDGGTIPNPEPSENQDNSTADSTADSTVNSVNPTSPSPKPNQGPPPQNGGASGDWGTSDDSQSQSTNPVANPEIPVKPVVTQTSIKNANNPDSLNLGDVYQGGIKAIQEKAKAEGDFAGAQAQIEKDNRQQLVDAQTNWNQQQVAMNQDISNALQDVKNGHIDPKHYLESMDTGQKISTAIGLVLGGWGSAYTHQGNPAMDFLNKQIDRDISAQKDNQNNKLNVYQGYLNTYKNAVVAENMARATQMAIYGSKIREAADKAGTPLAKANADAAINQLQQQMIPLVNNAHLMQQTSQFNNTGNPNTVGSEAQYQTILNGSQQSNPAFYKDAQEKYVPGVGVATHAVNDKDRDTLTTMHELAPLLDRAIADQQKYGMSGAWSAKNRADANADKEALNVQLNKLTGLSRLNGVEYENYGKQIGNIGGVNAGGTLETLMRLKQTYETEHNVLMQNLGIKPFSDAMAPSGLDQPSQKNLNVFLANNPGVSQGTAINYLREKGLIN